jgi:hypothetical protein
MPIFALPSLRSLSVLRLMIERTLELSLAALLLCLPLRMAAQTGLATLSGTVTDPSGAVIAKASVTVTNEATNVAQKTQTNGAGVYVVPALPPGLYRMVVEHQGFKQIEVEDLELHTQDTISRNFVLPVGAASETIQVNGNRNSFDDSPAVSMTVDREFVENMPLNGQSFQDLIQLAPSTVSDGDGGYSINGLRTDSNIYTVDGVSANVGGILNATSSDAPLSGAAPMQTALGTTQSLASVDSLQEFTIQTSGYTAEYGRSPGAQVQLTTRSGTNTIHGTLFDYFRNTDLDANSDFNDYFAYPKSAEHQNDFGGTVGGPAVVPRLYDGKDRTFYFFSYEGLRLLIPDSESEYVPTQAFRQWASPNVQPFLNAVPLPNGPVNSDGCTIPNTTTACDALFAYSFSNPNNLDNISVRLDHTLNTRLHTFLRYADTPSSEATGAEAVRATAINTHSWTAGASAKLKASILDDLRFNYTRDGEEEVIGPKPVDGSVPFPRDLLIPAAYDSPYAYGQSVIFVPGTSLRVNGVYNGANSAQHQYQFVNSFSWTRGKHNTKFGVDWRRLAPTYSAQPYGNLTELRSLTAIQQGFANLVEISASTPTAPVFHNLSAYAEDHWTALSRLSIDYGLRWEFNPPPGPANGEYPVVLTSDDLASATLAPLGTPPFKTHYDKFAPRIGFAWNAIPSDKHALTVRGGFGIFYDTAQTQIGNAYLSTYPFVVTGPAQVGVPLPLSSSALTPPSSNVSLAPPYPFLGQLSSTTLTLPYTEQWTLSLDESLNPQNKLTVSYVGTNGRKLLFSDYFGSNPYGNAAFGQGFVFTNNASSSSYNALQVQDTGRVSRGLDVVASFTYAHALDNASEDDSDSAPLWGNSDYDLRRVLNLALNYRMPEANGSRWFRVATNGWLLSNRFSAQSGNPLNITEDVAVLPEGTEVQYFVDRVPNIPIYLHGSAADVGGAPVPGSWRLNSAAFAMVPTDPTTGNPIRQGTLGRNYVRSPSFWTLNASLQRTFPIHDELHLNFRADAFNILNHPNLGGVDTYLPDSTFGQLLDGYTTLIGSANPLYAMGAQRSLQLSLKLQF